jgi:hypothetical protein
MFSDYKEKLLKEIGELPEETIPRLYRIFRILRLEFLQQRKIPGARGSLKGIWKGSEIDDALFQEAKKSVFHYEAR